MSSQVVAVPCLRDNYAYIVHRSDSRQAVVIDPSEAAPVRQQLQQRGLELVAILNTHHHWDHVGGNEELRQPEGLPVYAHQSDMDEQRVPGQTHALTHEQRFEVAGLSFGVLHVPGHTLGAVSYCLDDMVFTGDTLFIAGCGRLFEGTPEMMHRSLTGTLAQLPPDTKVYCGHEYTAANLRFAATVEPGNAAVRDKLAWATAQGEKQQPTIPSTIATLRPVTVPASTRAAGGPQPAATG